MAECVHECCNICLRCICHGSISLKKFGTISACPDCVNNAVKWAYDSACLWGGNYDVSCAKPKAKESA